LNICLDNNCECLAYIYVYIWHGVFMFIDVLVCECIHI
jgi:hypothetical protein